MKYKIKVYSIWDCGKRVDAQGNPHQEDSLFPAYGKQSDNDRLFILCDGMGGHDAGEVASATVCEAMSKSVLSHKDADINFSDDMFQQALSAAFDALDKRDTGAVKKMGTTMTFLKLHEKGATIAHMGDSRVYHIRQGADADSTEILFETRDHSLVNDQIKMGELTPEEAKRSPQKNVITRAMQPHMDRRPRADIYHTVDIRPGDYFYMCSDGMLEQMEDGNICYFFSKAAGNDKRRVEMMIDQTKENRDNHSAFIIHVLDVIDPLPVEEAPMDGHVGEVTDDADESEAEMVSLNKAATQTGTPVTPQAAVPEQPKPKSKVATILMCAVAVVLLAGLGFLIFRPSADSKQEPATEQLNRPSSSTRETVRDIKENAVRQGGTQEAAPAPAQTAAPSANPGQGNAAPAAAPAPQRQGAGRPNKPGGRQQNATPQQQHPNNGQGGNGQTGNGNEQNANGNGNNHDVQNVAGQSLQGQADAHSDKTPGGKKASK